MLFENAGHYFPACQGQKVVFACNKGCRESAPKIYHFIYPRIFFHQLVEERLLIPTCVVSAAKAVYQSAFLVLNFASFSVRLCRSKRLNFKNLLKILVSINFKFDKANTTRKYPTYTTWLWYWYFCLHNSRRAVDLSDTFKSFLLAAEPSEW